MTKTKTYDELLEEAQGFIKRDVPTRFKIAKILHQMNKLESISKIARDLGWHLPEVSQYIRVIEVWGERRIPEGKRNEWGGYMRPASWRDYTIVTSRSMNPCR